MQGLTRQFQSFCTALTPALSHVTFSGCCPNIRMAPLGCDRDNGYDYFFMIRRRLLSRHGVKTNCYFVKKAYKTGFRRNVPHNTIVCLLVFLPIRSINPCRGVCCFLQDVTHRYCDSCLSSRLNTAPAGDALTFNSDHVMT